MVSIASEKSARFRSPRAPPAARTCRIRFTCAGVNASFCPTSRPLFQVHLADRFFLSAIAFRSAGFCRSREISAVCREIHHRSRLLASLAAVFLLWHGPETFESKNKFRLLRQCRRDLLRRSSSLHDRAARLAAIPAGESPANRRLETPRQRNRRVGTTAKRRCRPHQMDVHNRQSPRQNGPCLSPHVQRVIITVQRWPPGDPVCIAQE